MSSSIERLAVNSWKNATITASWRNVSTQFVGMQRLALMQDDEHAADLAQFLSDLASYRAEKSK